MKRRGFTLVELLIIIAIIGVLSSMMMINATGSTGKAKAMTIANNVASCRTAATLYYSQVLFDSDTNAATTDTVIKKYVGAWDDFANGATIKYTLPNGAEAATATYEDWAINVDFSGDNEKDEIAEYLVKIPRFSTVYDYTTACKFQVNLWTGVISEYKAPKAKGNG